MAGRFWVGEKKNNKHPLAWANDFSTNTLTAGLEQKDD